MRVLLCVTKLKVTWLNLYWVCRFARQLCKAVRYGRYPDYVCTMHATCPLYLWEFLPRRRSFVIVSGGTKTVTYVKGEWGGHGPQFSCHSTLLYHVKSPFNQKGTSCFVCNNRARSKTRALCPESGFNQLQTRGRILGSFLCFWCKSYLVSTPRRWHHFQSCANLRWRRLQKSGVHSTSNHSQVEQKNHLIQLRQTGLGMTPVWSRCKWCTRFGWSRGDVTRVYTTSGVDIKT